MTTTQQIGADRLRNRQGFTLVELMIALAVGGIVMAAVMTSFLAQHETYLAQDEVVEMQQNARIAMDMLSRDIRSIGFDPDKQWGAGITVAIPADGVTTSLAFRRDNGAGAQEIVEYRIYDAFVGSGGDGRQDDLGRDLHDGGGIQPIAENVSRIEFRHLDGNGNPTGDPDRVRAIQVSILVQTANRAAKSPPPPQTYTTPSGAQWQSDNGFRSMFLTSAIRCRNLGL